MIPSSVELFVIGGGINGVGIAADAAGRGISTLVCERGDLGGGTSSASSKLIHGGLRYLEQFAFRLVRESLKEREILQRKAPHIIHPLEFILPYQQALRPVWMIHAGLFLYDHLGGHQKLPSSKKVDLQQIEAGTPLNKELKTGFSYHDCWVDDARLVILNAIAARQKGATLLTRMRCIHAEQLKKGWEIVMEDVQSGRQSKTHANVLINAAGPWVDIVNQQVLHRTDEQLVSLVKGSHIVVNKFYAGNHGYILQNFDKRIIFVTPFAENFALIGTTDVLYGSKLDEVTVSNEEISYLLHAINQYFSHHFITDDVVWSYAGVRPLKLDSKHKATEISRDYSLELDDSVKSSPLLTVIGGKITTYRRLAEHALEKLAPYFLNAGAPWTQSAVLPGGDMNSLQEFLQELQQDFSWLPKSLMRRYASSYGRLSYSLLNSCKSVTDLGKYFGADLYEIEIEYLCRQEWAKTLDDILWRRTKLGLLMSEEEKSKLEKWFKERFH